MSIVSDAPLTSTAIHAPQSKVSAPDYVEWHMILDNELDMLTDKETSLYGAIGFTALGAVLGVAPQTVGAYHSLIAGQFSGSDLTAVVICAAATATAAVCLVSFSVAKRKNGDLKATIRKRGSHPAS